VTDANLEQFVGALEASLAGGSFVKLTLAKRRGVEPGPKNVYARLVRVRGEEKLSFLSRHPTKDVVKNLPVDEGVRAARAMLGAEFLSAHLFTLEQDLRLEFSRKGASRLARRPPTFREPPDPAHDRKKRRAIEAAGSLYLRALGVTNERGEVRAAMGDKFRQINRFVEIVGDLLASSPLAGRDDVAVVDMGSGKGYLTFAVYDFLQRAGVATAEVTGVEARAELVEFCNRVARGSGFERLRFVRGLIEDFELPRTDVLIALHACDTATDDALHKGVRAGASVIITAPCCHKELRPQITPPEVLSGVLRHGILLEREAETLTDSLRALLLEAAGYRVKVFEFISTEHTRKNTMIAGVRAETKTDAEAALRQFRALKEFYGVREQRLETLLCEGRFGQGE
jgi:SAM-dependent methyltransferase